MSLANLFRQNRLFNGVGSYLVASGTKTWASGVDEGVDPLTISGLDGDTQVGYIIVFKYLINASNAGTRLQLRFNSDPSNVYYFVLGVNYAPEVDNPWDGEASLRLVWPDGAGANHGMGVYDIFTSQAISDNFVHVNGQYSVSQPGASVVEWTVSGKYEPPAAVNITSLTIDVNGTSHTGIEFEYKIFRYQ